MGTNCSFCPDVEPVVRSRDAVDEVALIWTGARDPSLSSKSGEMKRPRPTPLTVVESTSQASPMMPPPLPAPTPCTEDAQPLPSLTATESPVTSPGDELRDLLDFVEEEEQQGSNTVNGVLVPTSPSQRSRNVDPKIRKKRLEVAESNYQLRTVWKVPRTEYVCASSCLSAEVKPVVKKPFVTFSHLSTADAILKFGSNKRTCALNFANGAKVGGGYKTGAMAQEEDLCRRLPNLYTSLMNAKREGLYPFGPSTCKTQDVPAKYSDVLFTPDVVVARLSEQQEYKILPEEDQVKTSLVTAAAPNINFAKEVYDLDLMYSTVRTIFLAPRQLRPEIKVLILGAWGCGAFGCKPQDISELFARAIVQDSLGLLYEEVHFAIPEPGPGQVDSNASVFKSTLQRKGIAFQDLRQ